MNKIRSMVVGMGGSGPIDSIPGGIKQFTEANSDEFTCNYILEDLEKEGSVVKVYPVIKTGPGDPRDNSYFGHPVKEYSKTGYKWYTLQRAEADGVLELRCRYCSKVFKTDKERTKHFNNSHTPRRV